MAIYKINGMCGSLLSVQMENVPKISSVQYWRHSVTFSWNGQTLCYIGIMFKIVVCNSDVSHLMLRSTALASNPFLEYFCCRNLHKDNEIVAYRKIHYFQHISWHNLHEPSSVDSSNPPGYWGDIELYIFFFYYYPGISLEIRYGSTSYHWSE